MGDIEDKSGSDGDKVGQPEGRPQEMDYVSIRLRMGLRTEMG